MVQILEHYQSTSYFLIYFMHKEIKSRGLSSERYPRELKLLPCVGSLSLDLTIIHDGVTKRAAGPWGRAACLVK